MKEIDMDENVAKLDDRRGQKEDEKPKKNRVTMIDPGSTIRNLICFDEVDKLVRTGGFVSQIVTIIHGHGELKDMSRDAVAHLVNGYRDYVFSDRSVLDGDVRISPTNEDDMYYELHNLRRMYRDHSERIDMEVKTERSLQKLFSTTHKEIIVLERLTMSIMKLKKELGMLDGVRHGAQNRVGSGTPGRIDVAKVVADPEARQRVIGFVEALIVDPDMFGSLTQHTHGEKPPPVVKHKRRKRKKNKK